MGWVFILCTEKPQGSVWSELMPKKLMPAAESKELVVWSGPMTSKLLPKEVKEEWKDKIYVHLWHAVENMAWVIWCGQRTLVGVKVVVFTQGCYLEGCLWFIVSMWVSCCTFEKEDGINENEGA